LAHGLELAVTRLPAGSATAEFWTGALPVWIFKRSESGSTEASRVCVGVVLPGGVTTIERCASVPLLKS
jgi:hypothetical protein